MRKLPVHLIALCACLFLTGAVSAEERMKAAPAIDPSLLQTAPARQDECYRFGWRGWGKYKNCSCIKCSWKVSPTPQRLCWRIC